MAKKRRDVVRVPNEADVQNRLLANQLRAMPEPATICSSWDPESTNDDIRIQHHREHVPSPMVIVSWDVQGVNRGSECTWFCDACETACTDEQRNGQCCPKCGRHLEPGVERAHLVVAVRPCIRCGVVYLDKQRI